MKQEQFREELRKHDSARYFVLEGLTGLLSLIQQTNPENVLGASKKGQESTVDIREWNQDWVNNAKKIVTKMWEGADLLATDIVQVLEKITQDAKPKKPS